MSGQIVNDEADISISQASTIMMTDQLHGISFLHPTSVGVIVAIFRQPVALGIRDMTYSAFNLQLWVCLVAVWIMILVCLRIASEVLVQFGYNNYGGEGLGYDESVHVTGTTLPILAVHDPLQIEDIEFVKESGWWAISATSCISEKI
jgi:hypothetical protein